MFLRCLGIIFNSRGGEDSMEGGVKFVGARFIEFELEAQFTVDSTI